MRLPQLAIMAIPIFAAISPGVLAQPSNPYSHHSCAEIEDEHERTAGRINEIELGSIKNVRGATDVAAAKLLLFWPAGFLNSQGGHISEIAALRKISGLQKQTLDERRCPGHEASELKPTVVSIPQLGPYGENDSDAHYELALRELEEGKYIKVLWARALATSNGSETDARAIYIRARVKELTEKR